MLHACLATSAINPVSLSSLSSARYTSDLLGTVTVMLLLRFAIR